MQIWHDAELWIKIIKISAILLKSLNYCYLITNKLYRLLYKEIQTLLKDAEIKSKASDFLSKKSQSIKAKINQLQFGNNCTTSKKLICEVEQFCGFVLN